ncbi:quinol dehydrogenase ferredoxin subunit NapH [Pinisolibacter sp.]|uniref:quinol dehydrogenase ferredoxin subunit NapH n=1 Tax=Pinisolibacter sp. TaxID=2172024 RepID=UPI002FDE8828
MTAVTPTRLNREARLAAAGEMPARSFLTRNRFLIARRATQILVLALFLTGPLFGLWIAKGTIASSMTFDVLPLTDPFMVLQMLAARHWPEGLALIGALIVLAFYALVSGRLYCSWVCPINPVTDLAFWARERLGLQAKGWQPRPGTRWFVLAMALVVSAVTGAIAWELVNPITMAFRVVVFGSAASATFVAAVFLFDLFVARHGWCSHLCPVGAFYGLIGSGGLLRVSANRRAACDHCMDCYAVCPEPHVISPALEGAKKGLSPVILSRDCTACGRCIDVCDRIVFRFTHRFDVSETAEGGTHRSNCSGEKQ